MAGSAEHVTTGRGGLRPPAGPRTIVVMVEGEVLRPAIAGLCARARRLLASGDIDLITYDMGAVTEPDLVAIEAVARLQLTARRIGGSIQVRHASGELRDLLDLFGLCGVVPLCDDSPLESGGQVEQGEQAGVDEGVDRRYPAG